MYFLYIKALHIIFIVTWFSGMFYLVRLFIYHREAQDKPEQERYVLQSQFDLMMKRLLWGITFPSALLTLIFGIWLLMLYPSIPVWLHIKVGLVVLLFAYHYSLHIICKQLLSRKFLYTSTQLRLWNEVPTIFLVAIVMLVVVKQNMSLVYGVVGLMAFVILLMSAVKVYKVIREKKSQTPTENH
ncbi:CopD family protein [Thermoflexibacter ruber]|uniref:Protoporphyrinogen IX oxidase n=1 Tax=Thermoflexibacter ruber TaxID=1003 RepID=A0A1I2JDS3_9BACT|nr:CopD family protein [Thermoflexibacter ruber]SFF52120.1 putative membrane protein [Thermoflexibacter ruber]